MKILLSIGGICTLDFNLYRSIKYKKDQVLV